MSTKDLSKTTMADLAVYYNQLADRIGYPHVTRFSDKKSALRRIGVLEQLIATETPVEAVQVPPTLDQGEINDRFVAEVGVTPDLTPEEEDAADRVEAEIDEGRIEIADSEIAPPPAPKDRKSRKADAAPKEPRITKAGLIRQAFEASGLNGIHRDTLCEVSGHDAKYVLITMAILANPDRTKDPIDFVYYARAHTYYRREYVPMGVTVDGRKGS